VRSSTAGNSLSPVLQSGGAMIEIAIEEAQMALYSMANIMARWADLNTVMDREPDNQEELVTKFKELETALMEIPTIADLFKPKEIV